MERTKDTRQLNWYLAWAVVFCDIGTSVYYVPGILYGAVGDKTPFFILLTTLAFIPLALKYIEITWRSAFYHMLRGHVVKGLMKKLPADCHLMICN